MIKVIYGCEKVGSVRQKDAYVDPPTKMSSARLQVSHTKATLAVLEGKKLQMGTKIIPERNVTRSVAFWIVFHALSVVQLALSACTSRIS